MNGHVAVADWLPSCSGFLELSKDVFRGGRDFEMSLDFRTDQLSALLLFTYNTQTEDYMLVRTTNTLPKGGKQSISSGLIYAVPLFRWSSRVASCPSSWPLRVT